MCYENEIDFYGSISADMLLKSIGNFSAFADTTNMKEKICKFLNIPSEIVEDVMYKGKSRQTLRLDVKKYNGYPAKLITNKLIIYLEFH